MDYFFSEWIYFAGGEHNFSDFRKQGPT